MNGKNGNRTQIGISSIVFTILVLCIIGVLNFMASRYPLKWDLTSSKIHSLTDQSVKTVKRLQTPLQAVLFPDFRDRDRFAPLLRNYEDANPNFKLEIADPQKDVTRFKQLGVTKPNTLVLIFGDKQKRVDELTEEKITNALITLLDAKVQMICVLKGHGEKEIGSPGPEGYQGVKEGLENQGMTTKEITLYPESKVPADCNSVLVAGPQRSLFDAEVSALQAYLGGGGSAVFALDLNVKTGKGSPELVKMLEKWHVKVSDLLIVDLISRKFGGDPSMPLVGDFNQMHAVTKGFQFASMFPITRVLDPIDGGSPELKVEWIARTTKNSWGETDLKGLGAGKATFEKGKDKEGPLNVAIAVDGRLKDSKPDTKPARLVVFGTSHFATNQMAKFGGNLDLMLNALTWTLKEEGLISIRSREDAPGKIEISRSAAIVIFWIAVVALPVLIAAAGVYVWWRRRKL
jgi:ABC-type uncharacterized transport system involved in gliding motility auxiliary subunit